MFPDVWKPTNGRSNSGEWLEPTQRHNLAKSLVHKHRGLNDFVVSSKSTLRIIPQDALNVNSVAPTRCSQPVTLPGAGVAGAGPGLAQSREGSILSRAWPISNGDFPNPNPSTLAPAVTHLPWRAVPESAGVRLCQPTRVLIRVIPNSGV